MLFHVYSDPGHGWLKTTMQVLEKFEVSEKISRYSYRQGDIVWLEEDCDAPLLIKAVEQRGVEVKLADHHRNTESPIRYKPPYQSNHI